jgi:hypothetical protein
LDAAQTDDSGNPGRTGGPRQAVHTLRAALNRQPLGSPRSRPTVTAAMPLLLPSPALPAPSASVRPP